MRTQLNLFVLRLVCEPAKEVAEVGGGSAVFLRGHDLQHVLMRGTRRTGAGPVREIVPVGEELDARGLAVDVDDVTEVQAVALVADGGLPQLALDAIEVDGQPADVDRGLGRRSGLVGRLIAGPLCATPRWPVSGRREAPPLGRSTWCACRLRRSVTPTGFPSILRTRPSGWPRAWARSRPWGRRRNRRAAAPSRAGR